MNAWTSEDTAPSTMIVSAFGNSETVENSAKFASTIVGLAAKYGVNKFNVIVDGSDTDFANAPETFADCDKVELTRHDPGK